MTPETVQGLQWVHDLAQEAVDARADPMIACEKINHLLRECGTCDGCLQRRRVARALRYLERILERADAS
jgi:hypothetical protein